MITYKYFHRIRSGFVSVIIAGYIAIPVNAQFLDNFENKLPPDVDRRNEWTCGTGDGHATIDLTEGDGHMIVHVDARKDTRGIWWAIIRREVSTYLDLKSLSLPEYELRIETNIKVSHAPRRVNLSVNTQRTTDWHSNLMEFDIPDTVDFHKISYTTEGADLLEGDQINVQMALMDWGLAEYEVQVDYFKVDVVKVNDAPPDFGVQVPYHPKTPKVSSFSEKVVVSNDAMINPGFPELNFNAWYAVKNNTKIQILSVHDQHYIILRWDLSQYKGKQITGSGLLSLETLSVHRSDDYQKDFGMLRVSEVVGSYPLWDQETVTFNSFCAGRPFTEVINTQMIIDIKAEEMPYSKNYITISQPVLQRLADGKTQGIAIMPLGAVEASFFASEYKSGNKAATLHFNIQ